MQYHYVVIYDTDKKKWKMSFDSDAYFTDGYVWNGDRSDESGYGWFIPEDDSEGALLDQTLFNTLYSLVDTFPIPKEHENASA